MSATRLPVMPTQFEAELRGVAEAEQMQYLRHLTDATDHQFVALMAPGGEVMCFGQWRSIAELRGGTPGHYVIACTDGTEWLADRMSTRRYRSPASPSTEEES